MNGKPVFEYAAKTVINLKSGFAHKLLCDGPTFTAGNACAFSCSFCYVPDMAAKFPGLGMAGQKHEEIVLRRQNAVEIVERQLLNPNGKPRFKDPNDTRVIYASPLVDVAANMDLVRETVTICQLILQYTNWQIRLLSKSPLLTEIAKLLVNGPYAIDFGQRKRMIFGLSTGTLDDKLAAAFEQGCPTVSKRIKALHELQDEGWRTFGMICPSLPQLDYLEFAQQMSAAIRIDRCEHVWAEVMNVRGESMVRTCAALTNAGYVWESNRLADVSGDKTAWEGYARATFNAENKFIAGDKLRFLQYVTSNTRQWWQDRQPQGAILL